MKHVLAWSIVEMIDETIPHGSLIKPYGHTSIKWVVSTYSPNVTMFSIFPDDGSSLNFKRGMEEPTLT